MHEEVLRSISMGSLKFGSPTLSEDNQTFHIPEQTSKATTER
jgi:hypothetical protein